MQKKALYILGGFLGSGKTTTLMNLLEHFKDQKVAVLMNEYGDFNVDSHLIDGVPVNELLSGCICCDLKGDVEVQLHDIKARYNPDIIIIEATGIAHPVEVYDACTAPSVVDWLQVKQVITVLDGKRFLNRAQYSIQTRQLMEAQVKYSDILLVNKSDLLDEVEKDQIVETLKHLDARGDIIFTVYGKFDVSLLDRTSNVTSVHQHLHHGIQSLVYEFTGPVDARQFMRWLQQLPDSVLRIKGFLKFTENPNQVALFQYAYGVPQFEEEMMNLPLKLVIIGESLDKRKILDQLDVLQFS